MTLKDLFNKASEIGVWKFDVPAFETTPNRYPRADLVEDSLVVPFGHVAEVLSYL
jgi:hypothetical protein